MEQGRSGRSSTLLTVSHFKKVKRERAQGRRWWWWWRRGCERMDLWGNPKGKCSSLMENMRVGDFFLFFCERKPREREFEWKWGRGGWNSHIKLDSGRLGAQQPKTLIFVLQWAPRQWLLVLEKLPLFQPCQRLGGGKLVPRCWALHTQQHFSTFPHAFLDLNSYLKAYFHFNHHQILKNNHSKD